LYSDSLHGVSVLRQANHQERVFPDRLNIMLAASNAALVQDLFGIKIIVEYKSPDGKYVVHGAFEIDGIPFMAFDDFSLMKGSRLSKPPPCTFYLYVDDVDMKTEEAIGRGCKIITGNPFNPVGKPQDMFWGDRVASIEDPFGHVWVLAMPHNLKAEHADMKANEKAWLAEYDLL
jgi:PhnB protein